MAAEHRLVRAISHTMPVDQAVRARHAMQLIIEAGQRLVNQSTDMARQC